MNKQAIEKINDLIKNIKYESDEDEGAAEWQGHLETVKEQLEAGELTVPEAEESLGIKL